MASSTNLIVKGSDSFLQNSAGFSQRPRFHHCIFGAAVGFIGVSSLHDALLVFQHRKGIQELNPICDWLISLEPDSASFFLLGKGLGTLAVMSVLLVLYKFWQRIALPVAYSLVVFQCGLLCFLHGYDDLNSRKAHFAATQMTSPSPPSMDEQVEIEETKPIPRFRQRDGRNRKSLREKSKSHRWQSGLPRRSNAI